MYARAGIPIYWIVNLCERQLEVYTEPIDIAQQPTYQQRQNYSLSDEVAVAIAKRCCFQQIEGREVGRLIVRDLLPGRAIALAKSKSDRP